MRLKGEGSSAFVLISIAYLDHITVSIKSTSILSYGTGYHFVTY